MGGDALRRSPDVVVGERLHEINSELEMHVRFDPLRPRPASKTRQIITGCTLGSCIRDTTVTDTVPGPRRVMSIDDGVDAYGRQGRVDQAAKRELVVPHDEIVGVAARRQAGERSCARARQSRRHAAVRTRHTSVSKRARVL